MEVRPYWYLDRPQRQVHLDELPEAVDVAVVGGGYTGLSTALHLARSGCSVAVLEAEHPGFGCSARNGGMVGPSFHKLGLAGLRARYGQERARTILQEGMNALEFFKSFIETENIHCDMQWSGRFRGAFSPRDYENLNREAEDLQRAVGLEFSPVPRSQQYQEIGSDFYHGGVIYHRDGGIHPGKLVDALVARVRTAGGRVVAPARVLDWRREGDAWWLDSAAGTVRARELVVATNGYTGSIFPRFRRRLVPIVSAMVATEPLDPALVNRLIPGKRVCSDTRRLVLYYRPSPDGTRLLFGSRAPGPLSEPQRIARGIRDIYQEIFPELRQVDISHYWWGWVAYTFDHAPHLGDLDGVYHAMGYCGSGITRSVYLGRQLARKILGAADHRTAFDDLRFETRPLYRGKPWGLGLVLHWHALRDFLARRMAA